MPCGRAAAAAINLGSSDSFDGSSSSSSGVSKGGFTSKQTSDASGTTYTFTSDVIIQNVSSIIPEGKSCFDNSAGSLTFIGGGHSLTFQTLHSPPFQAAVIKNTNTALSFSNFSSLTVKNTTRIYDSIYSIPDDESTDFVTNYESAVFVTNTTGGDVTFTQCNLEFTNNVSKQSGGCISAHTITVTECGVTFENSRSEQNGGTLAAIGNIVFKNNKKIDFKVGMAEEHGGILYSKSGEIALISEGHNNAEFYFHDGGAKAGGAWYAENNCSIINTNLTHFHLNQTITSSIGSLPNHEGCGGAICCYIAPTDLDLKTGLTISKNRKIDFDSNGGINGGAIYATKCNLSENTTLMCRNNVASRGGGLYVENDCSINNNVSFLLFKNFVRKNLPFFIDQEGCGGAIYNITTDSATTSGLTISGNQAVVIAKSEAVINGGAIYATKCTLSDNKFLYCQGNSASLGGAIYAKILHLISGGPHIFFSNTGGAIEITSDGELELVAAKGDIIFLGNGTGVPVSISEEQASEILTLATADPNNPFPKSMGGDIKGWEAWIDKESKKNLDPSSLYLFSGIHLGTGAKISKLDARKGYSIYFYDPLTTEPPKSGAVVEPLKINALKVTPSIISSGEKPTPEALKMSISKEISSGTLVFSGEKLTPKEAARPENRTSTIHQNISLESGNLVLQGDAVLAVHSFTQQPDSMLFMDTGTSLETTSKSNAEGSITITNLSVDLKSLNDKKLAKIAVKSPNGKLKLSGTLTLYSNSADYYENLILGKDLSLPLLELSAFSGDINTKNFDPIPKGTDVSTYGHQGTWSLVSNTKPNGTMTFSLIWKVTGYKPAPERHTSLVPNSLWSVAIDLYSIHDVLTTHMHNIPSNRNLWIVGISNFFHKDKTTTNTGFRHISGGYIIGGSRLTPSDTAFAIAIGQLSRTAKDSVISNIKSRIYTGSLCGQHQESLRLHSSLRRYALSKISLKIPEELPLVLNTQVTYTRNHNDMTTKYAKLPPGTSSWNNQGFAAELGSSLPLDFKSPYFTSSTPFLKLQLVYANQKSFEEKTTTARGFTSSHLVNLSIPLGVTFTQHSTSSYQAIQATLSYILDVYRIQPKCLTSFPTSGVSWMTWATNLERHAGKIQIASHHSPLPNFNFSMQGSFESRASSRNYNANCVGSYSF
ncbi:polymorphic outer membrane protein middle domain-containing protein [Candidatus Chlamydia sanziniae]|nr:polymorphic outer membrane protein middle domain-containing protein [Candidatus Chlamydia sanziniae]